jgi:CheY-like chemotaxis protein
MFRILILDHPKGLLSPLDQELRDWPDLSIAYLQSYVQAIHLIELSPPDLIIAAFACEQANGFEIIWELKRRLGEIPELMFYLPKGCQQRREILEFLDLGLYSVQEDIQRVFRMVRDRVDRKKQAIPHEGLSFSEVGPQILLAMTSGLEVVVQVLDSDGPRGEILVSKGGIWSAQDAKGKGPEAFLRLLDQGVSATCALIDKELMGPYEFDKEPDENLQELIDNGIESILRKDLKKAAEIFLKAEGIAPSNPLIHSNIQRLQALGFIPLTRKTHNLGISS